MGGRRKSFVEAKSCRHQADERDRADETDVRAWRPPRSSRPLLYSSVGRMYPIPSVIPISPKCLRLQRKRPSVVHLGQELLHRSGERCWARVTSDGIGIPDLGPRDIVDHRLVEVHLASEPVELGTRIVPGNVLHLTV